MNGFAQAIRTVWSTKGRSPWDQGGVSSVELCGTIHEHLKDAHEASPHPLLEKMLDMTSVHEEFHDQCEEIKSLQNEIQEIAEVVKEPDNIEELTLDERKEISAQKADLLEIKKGEFYLKSQETSTETDFYKEVMENFFKVTNSFGEHLLTHLEVPNMPSTNNGTEQFFGKIRTKLRRITGRQNNHSLISTRGDYISLTLKVETYEDLKGHISSVSYKDYVEEKNRHLRQTLKPRIQAKIKKDSKGFLEMMVWSWKIISEREKPDKL